MKTYKGLLNKLKPNQIFVFGSNTQGIHGAGAARAAVVNFNARYGQAKGLQGQSWAIVTKDLTKEIHPSISKLAIITQISELYDYAQNHKQNEFFIAYSGNGYNLNGYSNYDMAEMFVLGAYLTGREIPDNIVFEKGMMQLVNKYYDFIQI